MDLKTKEAADRAGITVRTLHHYDRIGILKPGGTTPAGYRLYTRENLMRLQQILFFKEIGFSLEEIAGILDAPGFDRKRALEVQKEILQKKRRRITRMISTVERMLEEGEMMKTKDYFNGLDDAEILRTQEQYADEIRQKYGETEAWKESQKRAQSHTAEDYRRFQEENTVFFEKAAGLVDREIEAPEVVALVEEWRDYISANFYTCTPEILRGLGEMYREDDRYAKNMNRFHPRLADFMSRAILAYCDR